MCSLGAIEKAIIKSDVGLNPNNDGNVIRLNVPQLTSDRRKVLQGSVSGFAFDKFRLSLTFLANLDIINVVASPSCDCNCTRHSFFEFIASHSRAGNATQVTDCKGRRFGAGSFEVGIQA